MSREDLQIALDALAKAHGSAELTSAMRTVQRTVRTNRKAAGKEVGPFARAVMEALDYRDTLKAQGVSGKDLDKGLEAVLREVWPKGQGDPNDPRWALCAECNGYGLVMHDCPGDATCGRYQTHAPHDYGTPCWCDKGRRFREKPKPEASEFTDAGKTPKRSGPSRFGR